MQLHTGEKPVCGNNLHICVYGYEIKKEMSPIAHCVYILKNATHFVGFVMTWLISNQTWDVQQPRGSQWGIFLCFHSPSQCTVKFLKLRTPEISCNHPKSWTRWLYLKSNASKRCRGNLGEKVKFIRGLNLTKNYLFVWKNKFGLIF